MRQLPKMETSLSPARCLDVVESRLFRELTETLASLDVNLQDTWKVLETVSSVCGSVRTDYLKTDSPSLANVGKRPASTVESGDESLNSTRPSQCSLKKPRLEAEDDTSGSESSSPQTETDRQENKSGHPESYDASSCQRERSLSSINTANGKAKQRHSDGSSRSDPHQSSNANADAAEHRMPSRGDFNPWTQLCCDAYDDIAAEVEGMVNLEAGPAVLVLLTMWGKLPLPHNTPPWKSVLDACIHSRSGKRWMNRYKKISNLPSLDFANPKVRQQLRIRVREKWMKWLDLSLSDCESDSEDESESDSVTQSMYEKPVSRISACGTKSNNRSHHDQWSSIPSDRNPKTAASSSCKRDKGGLGHLAIERKWAGLIVDAFEELSDVVDGISELKGRAIMRLVYSVCGRAPVLKTKRIHEWARYVDVCRQTDVGKRCIRRFEQAVDVLPVLCIDDIAVVDRVRNHINRKLEKKASVNATVHTSVEHVGVESTQESREYLDRLADLLAKEFGKLSEEVKEVSTFGSTAAVQLLLAMCEVIPVPSNCIGNNISPWVDFVDVCRESYSGKACIERFRSLGLPSPVDLTHELVIKCLHRRFELKWKASQSETDSGDKSGGTSDIDTSPLADVLSGKFSASSKASPREQNPPSATEATALGKWTDIVCEAADEIAKEVEGVSRLKSASICRLVLATWGVVPVSKPHAQHPWKDFVDICLQSNIGQKWLRWYNEDSNLPTLDLRNTLIFNRLVGRVDSRYKKRAMTS